MATTWCPAPGPFPFSKPPPNLQHTMKLTTKLPTLALLPCSVLFCACTVLGQTLGQWDFNSSNLVQTAGANLGDLQYADGPAGATATATAFGTTASLGIPDINGTSAIVMRFPAATNGMG